MNQELLKLIESIRPADQSAMGQARERQAQLTKPAGALGDLEELSIRLAGIFGKAKPHPRGVAVIVAAGDHGVAQDGARTGHLVIRDYLRRLEDRPGVYRMFDAKGDVLYVGKAKNLKARVGSYARGQAHSNRIARMISQTAAMEFVTTATETEALLLEATSSSS